MTSPTKDNASKKPGIFNPHADRVVLAHGGGGQLTDELLDDIVRPRLANVLLDSRADSAILNLPPGRVAFTTDSFVVKPIEFPGGDIGRLAVCGTVNDLCVSGAKPLYLSLGLILEEGLELALLKRVIDSVAAAAKEAGVAIVTGDTKVVPRGDCDGIYINTAGVGVLPTSAQITSQRVEAGDVVFISGTIGDHGLAVMMARDVSGGIKSDLASDAAPLNGLVDDLLDTAPELVFLRDATRGGLAGVLADLAEESGLKLAVDELKIPVRDEARYAAEMLGLDPLSIANEGKLVVVARAADADAVEAALRAHPLGKHASRIGSFETSQPGRPGLCELLTAVGGRRIVLKPYGEELPRIC